MTAPVIVRDAVDEMLADLQRRCNTTQKNAHGAGATATVGQIQNPYEKERIMDQSTIPTAQARADVRKIVETLAAAEVGSYVTLEPGDALHAEPAPVVFKTRDQLINDPPHGEHETSFVDWIRSDGTIVPISERGDNWWMAVKECNGWDDWQSRALRYQPNRVVRFGADLIVTRGTYVYTRTAVRDGVQGFEFLTIGAYEAEKREAFLSRHPEFVAAKPTWATRIEPEDESHGYVPTVSYYGGHGLVTIGTMARLISGAVEVDPVDVWVNEAKTATVEDLRDLAADALAAVYLLGGVAA